MRTRCPLYSRLSLLLLAFVLLVFSSCSDYNIYSVKSKPKNQLPGGFLYALPRTYVSVAVTFDKVDYSGAPYSDYASELLGLSGINKDSIYSIHSIEIATFNNADPNYYYFVNPGHLSVSIDSRNLLQSVGVTRDGSRKDPDQIAAEVSPYMTMFEKAIQEPAFNLYDRTDTFYVRNDRPGRPSLITTKKDTRSVRQKALDAAREIEEIRQKKQELMFGEYEGDYNTATIQYLCQQLDRQEQMLLELFVGKVSTETVYFTIDPLSDKDHIASQTYLLFHYTPSDGIVDSTYHNVIGVQCNITCTHPTQKAINFVHYRTGALTNDSYKDRHSFKYRIPEKANVTVFSNKFSFSKEVKISQFGTVASLPYGRYKALFDPNTGDLIYIDIH